MAKQLNVNLAFTADTSQAKAQLQSLQTQLSGLLNSTNGQSFGNQITGDINKASKAIAELKLHLKNATNVNTGNLDFTKLNESLNKSGTTLQQYGDKLRSLGPAGQQAFNTLASSIAQSEIPIRRSNAALTELWTTLKNTVRWQISSSILHGFMGTISGAVGYAKDLNKSLNDIRIVTGASVDEMARFAEQANRSAKALSASTTAYTKASLIYYQQGLDDQAVKERTDVTIKMANVSSQSAETVSDQMTAVWNNFAKGGENLERFADVMVRLGADTASSSDEIAQGLEKFAAIGDMVGLSFDNAAAALATVTATTRQSADVVGTAFKTIFARIQGLKLGETLEDGTDLNKYSEALAAVGISVKEQNGELKDMDNILAEMGAKWKTLSKDQQVALAQTVAGLRQYNQLVALMENFDFYEKNLQSAKNSEGSLQEQADIYAESWQAASDRVKAATQGIYEDLLNDKAFIDVLNTIEKILTYVDNLIDGLGGLGGVLTTIGALLTRAFSSQIAQSMTSIVNSIKMMTAAGREQAQQQKAQFMKDSADAMRGMSDGSNEGNMRAAMMEDQLRLQTSMIENSERMSTEEQQINQMLLDRQRILSDNAVTAAKELDAATEARSDATFNARVELAQEARGWAGGDLEVQKKNLSDFTKQFNQVQQKLKQGITARVNLEELRKLPVEGEKGKQVIDKIKQAVDKIDDTEIKEIVSSLDTMELNAESVEDAIAALTIRLREMQGASETNMMDENNEWMLSEDAVHGLSTAYEDEAMAALRTKDAEEQANEARDNAANSINNATGAQKTWADQMVAGANVVMSVISALQAFAGIIDVATNPDMSGWEKFLSIGSSLAMMFVMLAPLLQGTNLQFLAMVSSTVAAKVGLKGTSLAALEASAATGTLSASLWTLLWPIGLVIAAIAALIGIIALIGSVIKDNKMASLDGQLEATEEASNNLAESLRKTQEEADNLKSAFDSYNSVVEELKQCEKGTDEWREALEKVNNEVITLLDRYPELAGYIDSSGKAGIYRDSKTGALAVNENFFKDKNQSLESGIENISIGKALTDQRQAVLEQQNAEEELSSLLFDKLLVSAEDIRNGMVQDLIDSYMGKSDKTFADIFSNKPESVLEGFFDILEDSSTGLSDAFQKVAQASNKVALGFDTTGTTIANLVLGNNQKVQNSQYAERVITASGKQYEDFYKEAINEINAETGGAGWGKEGVSKWTKTNQTAEKYLEDYLKATGEKIEDYELLDTYGDDDARRFKFKKKNAEDSEAKTLGLQQMLDVIASERVKEKMEGFGVGLTQAVEQLDNFVSSTTDMSQIQKDTIGATKDFLLDQNFKNTGLVEINAIDDYIGQLYNGDIGAYLGATFGGDNGILDDEEAQALGYDSAQIMIEAFKSGLNEVDLSNFSKTIQDIVNKGADVSASIAQRYSEMVDINSTFGTVEGSTEVTPGTSPYVYTEAQSERVRFDRAVQSGLSEEPTKANEELTRMVELLEQAPAGFQNLSEAANRIESSSVAEFNEKLQDVIDTFNDYADLDFTDIADGIIDENEAKDLDINTKSLNKYIDMLEKTEEGAGKTKDELMELVEASLKTAKAFSDLKDNWKDYRKNLQSGDIIKQADAIEKIGDAFKGVFGFDLSELDISDTFLTDAENIQLVEDAINGVDGALEKLQSKLFNEIIIDAVGEENVQNVINELINAGIMLENQSFEAAFTADPSGFLNALAQSENAAKISASAIQAAVSSMGYSMSYETETAETTQTAQTDGGYSWQTVQGTPFQYEYIKNTEPGEEPVKDSITITPVGLKKIPNAPVEVSTTQLTGGSATNYQFGDGTSTNNSVSMADIKNIKVNKNSQTPTSKSVKGAAPLVNTGSKGGGGGRGGGGGGGGSSANPAKKSKLTKRTDIVERHHHVNKALETQENIIDRLNKQLDKLYGKNRLKQIQKIIEALRERNNIEQWYIEDAKKYEEIDKNALIDFYNQSFKRKYKETNRFVELVINPDGSIGNLEQIQEGIADVLNSYETKNNQFATQEEQEVFKENVLEPFQDLKEDFDYLVDLYYTSREQRLDMEAQNQETKIEIQELILDKIVSNIELKIEIEDTALEVIDYYMSKIEDDVYKTAEAIELLGDRYDHIVNKASLAYKKYNDILWEISNNPELENNIDYLSEQINKAIPEIISAMQDLQETDQEMMEYYGNFLEKASEEFEKYTIILESGIDKLEVYKNLLSLTGREMNYDAMEVVLKGQLDTIKNSVSSYKEYYDFVNNEYTALYNRWLKEKDTLDKKELGQLEKKLYDAQIALDEAEANWLDSLEQQGEIAQEILENNLAKARKTFENYLMEETFGEDSYIKSIEDYIQKIDRLANKQEEYLTKTNQLYETNKLLNQAQLAIDKTTNNQAKQQYKNYMKNIEELQKQSKISQQDLAIAQAKFEILQAEIALKEAQDAKNQVRLTRDAEGNYGYIYTANQDDVANAEQEYADKQNALYNIGLEGVKNYQSQYAQTMQEAIETFESINEQYRTGQIASETEYNQKMQEAQKYYYNLLKTYNDEYYTALDLLVEESSTNRADYTQTDIINLSDFKDATDQYLEDASDSFDDYETNTKEVSETVGKDLTTLKNNTEKVTKKSDELGKEINNDLIPSLEDEALAVREVTSKWGAQRDEIYLNIAAYEKMIKQLQQVQYYLNGGQIDDYSIVMAKHLSAGGSVTDAIYKNMKIERSEKASQEGYELENKNQILFNWLMEEYEKGEDQKVVDYVNSVIDSNGLWDYDIIKQLNSNYQYGDIFKLAVSNSDKFKTNSVLLTDIFSQLPGLQEKIDELIPGIPIASEIYWTYMNSSQKAEDLKKYNITPEEVSELIKKRENNSEMRDTIYYALKNLSLYYADKNVLKVSDEENRTIDTKEEKALIDYILKIAEDNEIFDFETLKNLVIAQKRQGGAFYNRFPRFDTGGYTGSWGPEGRLAVLHEKELILNKQDTENFLSATTMLREISQMLDNNALAASLGMINLRAMTIDSPADQILQQEVTIHADFPNVTDHNEIEMAIDNLINAASQYAYRK